MGNCIWPGNNPIMQQYHDKEWCVPVFDDSYLFEMLTLEGAQAGLSWQTVLNKRNSYKQAFHDFDIRYCSQLSDEQLEEIRTQYDVIKNSLKLKSVKSNARAIMRIQSEWGSFSGFLWSYVDHKPVINNWESESQVPAQTPLSEQISKDLKKRKFTFVGPVIIYSFMQAVGMVDDHIKTCPYHTMNKCLKMS